MATKRIGILTAGGDAPGLNAAIRGLGKAAIQEHGWKLIGFRDGMRGLAENRFTELDGASLSGILTIGGTMLGTSRDKVHRMVVDGQARDMIPTIVENYEKDRLDALVCLGGGGTAKNAKRLMDAGLNVLHLPKTIDNDIVGTDTSFGFATALEIATEAVDRLHSTAHSHHRIILTEIMGHRAGWLALGAGIAGGADVILLPEIPYDVDAIAERIERRRSRGSTFSVVAVAEGALNKADREEIEHAEALVKDASTPEAKAAAKRGVEVTLILPAKVDSLLVRYASRAYYPLLLSAGVKLAMFEGGLVHAKTMTIDEDYALFGTVNMDMRSFFLNLEISLAIYDKHMTNRIYDLQRGYLADSRYISVRAWQQRAKWWGLGENTVRLMSPLL